MWKNVALVCCKKDEELLNLRRMMCAWMEDE
jgi:hypothetical protein